MSKKICQSRDKSGRGNGQAFCRPPLPKHFMMMLLRIYQKSDNSELQAILSKIKQQ